MSQELPARRRVLFIAYFFPPLGGAGVYRTLKFVKYLPEFGWEAVVLTCQTGRRYLQDISLHQDIPPGTPIHRAPILDPDPGLAFLNRLRLRPLSNWARRWLALPDLRVGWLPGAYRMGRNIIRQESIQAIYSTSFPYTGHLIGQALKKASGLPWVADFRDEWTQNPSEIQSPSLHRRLSRQWEHNVLQEADRVISVSPIITQGLKELLPPPPPEKFATIVNGYDPDDFSTVDPYQRTEKFTLAYTGALYGPRTANFFLAALADLLQKNAVPADRIRVRWIGTFPGLKAEIERHGLQEQMEILGYQPHHAAIHEQRCADGLLLLLPTLGGEGAVTGKIFEYLASGKPILALVPPQGVAAQLLRQAGSGWIVPPEDVAAISQAILQLYRHWQSGQSLQPNWEVIRQYDRRILTQKLAALLDEITPQSSAHQMDR